MMQFTHHELGSGKGQGFNPLPDWSRYCLLQIWENEQQVDRFFI